MHSQNNPSGQPVAIPACESLYCPYCKDTFGRNHFYRDNIKNRDICRVYRREKFQEWRTRNPRKRKSQRTVALRSKVRLTSDPLALAMSIARFIKKYTYLYSDFYADVRQTCALALLEIGVKDLEKPTLLDWCAVSRQVQRSLYRLSKDLGYDVRDGPAASVIEFGEWTSARSN